MPKSIIYTALVLLILAMIPPALIARTRAVPSGARRIHLIQDMDNQGKFRAQQSNLIFADRRAMRPPVEGAIARGGLHEDDHFYRGVIVQGTSAAAPEWAADFPRQIEVNMALMERGADRFDIYCRVCHGDAGYGDGMIHRRADQLVRLGRHGTTWVQPKSLHEPDIRIQPPGQIFNTITNGIRNMAGYASQIPVEDRWAIVAYVKALQRSQHAQPQDVPAEQHRSLPLIPLPPEQVQNGAAVGEEVNQ